MATIEALIANLGNPSWMVRKDAINRLLAHPENSYMHHIEAFLKSHDDATLRNGSMEMFRTMGARAVPFLARLLKDPDEEARLFSANLLGDIGDKRAVRHLAAALRDEDVNVRIASAEALGKTGDSEALDALSRAIDDEAWVAQAAIKSIGDIGGEHALTVLYKCLERAEYRGMALDAIEKAGNSGSIRRLTPFVDSDELRELALKAIVNIADREGMRPMPGYFTNLVPLLIELHGSPRPELRKAALIALSWSEDTKAIPCLVDALSDEELQEYGVSGLMAIGKKAAPSIMDALKDSSRHNRPAMAKLLSMLGEHMALLQFARDEDPEVRVEAALALGKIPSARSVEHLSMMLKDPEDEVRAAAHRALDSLNKVI